LFERSGILEISGGESHFVSDVGDALRMTDCEELGDEGGYENYAGDEGGG